ncbi:MAG: hypothetical protein HYR96_05950 [Deltaproteobacteria bacterium]|nr:hypothetical protein [Deltaproteobacteria bacterium]MBI3296101.1 hypothetical protein [Deltaproteobacteria bacterium]
MIAIDSKTLKKFLRLAGDRLKGKWVIIGGTVLPLLGIDYRSTIDIDIAGPKGSDQTEMLTLMEIAQELSLPVEAINQAAGFFLFKIKGWEKNLVELHRGKTASLYRPNAKLYLELKIPRLNETDLEDCLRLLQFEKAIGSELDLSGIRQSLAREIVLANKEKNAVRVARLQRLQSIVSSRGD